jgi:hypothetical protein
MIANAAELFHTWVGLADPLFKAQRKHEAGQRRGARNQSHPDIESVVSLQNLPPPHSPLARTLLMLVQLQLSSEAKPALFPFIITIHSFLSKNLRL